MGYNPADYAAVQAKAKAMSKQELEDLYVKKKDENYMPVCAIVFITLLVVGGLFAIIYVASASGKAEVYADIQKISTQIADEVCPLASDAYLEVDFEGTKLYDLKIDCLEYRER